jgi:hypothetical protein
MAERGAVTARENSGQRTSVGVPGNVTDGVYPGVNADQESSIHVRLDRTASPTGLEQLDASDVAKLALHQTR